jgi:hypothetical protein
MKEKLVRICARGAIAINLRGMEYMQVREGEDEDAAWKRMRGKLGTGKHLDETYVLSPQAVPHAEGAAAPTSPSGAGPGPGASVGSLPPSSETGAGVGADLATGGQPSAVSAAGGGIFGGEGKLRPLSTVGATSALNLLGKIESWGISTGTQVQDVQIKVSTLTGAQLNELLKKLPDGITYELSLNKEEK